jgi:LPXTG-motif cell wall-anchored protein
LAIPAGVSPIAIAVALAAGAGGILMLLTEVTTVISIDVAAGSCDSIYDTSPELADDCEQTGFERSSVALLLLGLLTLVMGAGAAFGRSRPAAVALVVIGVVVLGITLLVDLPASDETGLIGRRYEAAEATAGPGLWLELVGGGLALLAGVIRLVRPDD